MLYLSDRALSPSEILVDGADDANRSAVAVRPAPRGIPRHASRLPRSRFERGTTSCRGGLRILLLVTSLAVLSVGIPAFLIADVSDLPRSEAWVVTLVLLVWAGVRLSLLWVRGTPRLFDFFFWLFVYIFMGIAPTAQILSGLTSTTTPGVDTGLDMPTAGVVVLGVFCYEVGRLLFMLREGRRRTAGRPLVVRPVSKTGAPSRSSPSPSP